MADRAKQVEEALKVLAALTSDGALAGLAADAIIANNPTLAPLKPLLAQEIGAALGAVKGSDGKPGVVSRLLSWFR